MSSTIFVAFRFLFVSELYSFFMLFCIYILVHSQNSVTVHDTFMQLYRTMLYHDDMSRTRMIGTFLFISF